MSASLKRAGTVLLVLLGLLQIDSVLRIWRLENDLGNARAQSALERQRQMATWISDGTSEETRNGDTSMQMTFGNVTIVVSAHRTGDSRGSAPEQQAIGIVQQKDEALSNDRNQTGKLPIGVMPTDLGEGRKQRQNNSEDRIQVDQAHPSAPAASNPMPDPLADAQISPDKFSHTAHGMPFIPGAPAETALSGDGCKVLLNLATTVMESQDQLKVAAQQNVLRAMGRLRAYGVRSYVFTDSAEWAERARKEGLLVVEKMETNEFGKPLLAQFFQHSAQHDSCPQHGRFVFDGYMNGDIAFSSSLMRTLVKVRDVWAPAISAGRSNGVLVIGKRRDANFKGVELWTDEAVDGLAQNSDFFRDDAIDFFIYSRGAMDWSKVPRFCVGRRGYDNWLVNHGCNNLDAIDVSLSAVALHLNAKDGSFAGHKGITLPDRDYNMKFISQKDIAKYKVSHVHFLSKNESGLVTFHARKARPVPAASPNNTRA